MNKILNKWTILSMIWFILIIYGLLFHESQGGTPPPIPHFDKLAHGLLFFGQFWLLSRAFFYAKKSIPFGILWCLALLLAIGSEWAQAAFTTTRQADVWDGVADMFGATIALITAKYATQIWTRQQRKIKAK